LLWLGVITLINNSSFPHPQILKIVSEKLTKYSIIDLVQL